MDQRKVSEQDERLRRVSSDQRAAAMKMRAEARRMTVTAGEMMTRVMAARTTVARQRAG